MTLQLTAAQLRNLHHTSGTSFRQDSSGSGSERSISVCILQVVPWYVRVWLHTLQLTIDGQVGGWALFQLSAAGMHPQT
jgi:hypothetical protein